MYYLSAMYDGHNGCILLINSFHHRNVSREENEFKTCIGVVLKNEDEKLAIPHRQRHYWYLLELCCFHA